MARVFQYSMAATAPRARMASLAPKLAAPPVLAGLAGPVVVVLAVELVVFDEELLEVADDVVEVVFAVAVLWADNAEEATEERAEFIEEATEA
jgi:hypothetical protein